MAKIHLDRLKNRYGFKGQKYQSLIKKIIANNDENISRKITKLNQSTWDRSLRRIASKAETFVIPDLSDVLPARSVFVSKAAESGKLITDTLRDSLTKNLRDSLKQFTPKTGEATFIRRRGVKAGTINEKLINTFEKDIRKTFGNYVKKDPRYGMPSNIHTIAVTEFRGVVIPMKISFMENLGRQNPNLIIEKTWIHNASLSKEPRRGHQQQDRKTIKFANKFKVPLYKKIGKRFFKIGVNFMKWPYDIDAPLEQKINCNCDILFKARKK